MAEDVEKIEAIICAYIDGEATPAERAQIEQHLAQYPEHMAMVRELMEQRNLLRQLPRDRAPADLNDELQGQLEREALLSEDHLVDADRVLRPNRWPQIVSIAAILMLAAGLGIVVYSVLPPRYPAISVLPPVTTAPNRPHAAIAETPVDADPDLAPLAAGASGERAAEADRVTSPLREVDTMRIAAADTPRRDAGGIALGRATANTPAVIASNDHLNTVVIVRAEDIRLAQQDIVQYLVANQIAYATPENEAAGQAVLDQLIQANAAQQPLVSTNESDLSREMRSAGDSVKLQQTRSRGGKKVDTREGDAAQEGGVAPPPQQRTEPSPMPQPAAPAVERGHQVLALGIPHVTPDAGPATAPATESVASSAESRSFGGRLGEAEKGVSTWSAQGGEVTAGIRGGVGGGEAGWRGFSYYKQGEAAAGAATLPAGEFTNLDSRVIIAHNIKRRQVAELADVLSQPQRRQRVAVRSNLALDVAGSRERVLPEMAVRTLRKQENATDVPTRGSTESREKSDTLNLQQLESGGYVVAPSGVLRPAATQPVRAQNNAAAGAIVLKPADTQPVGIVAATQPADEDASITCVIVVQPNAADLPSGPTTAPTTQPVASESEQASPTTRPADSPQQGD